MDLLQVSESTESHIPYDPTLNGFRSAMLTDTVTDSRDLKAVSFPAQLLQEQARKGDELWASVDKSYQSLVELVHHGTARFLDDHMEEERQRLEA